MSALTEEAVRARLRAGAAPARRQAAARPPWHRPLVTDFRPETRILAFDASLKNVGWVVLVIRDRVIVEEHGTFHPADGGEVGYMATWRRARDLQRLLWDAGLVVRCMRDPAVLKAVEAPLVGAGFRVESSLVAGMVCWLECGTDCVPVAAAHVSAVLLGDAVRREERKAAVKEAVLSYVPEAKGRGWDEHQRDALSVALVRLFDLGERAES